MPANHSTERTSPPFGTRQVSPPPAWNEPGYVDPDGSLGLEVGTHYWQGYAKKNAPRDERAMSPTWVAAATDPGMPEPGPDLPPAPTPTEPSPPSPEIQPREEPGIQPRVDPGRDAQPWIRMEKKTERDRFSEQPTDQWPG